ncbi:uncharacterized protein [Primulina huaijiensis]|uniref:uncharacterized protein n=1 Tax=Primulina huaijiensis TaxID=1492673 RepID=UPI003CC76D20
MAENTMKEKPSTASSVQDNPDSPILLRLVGERRTWVCLFVSVYSVLLYLSWNLLTSVLNWYESESSAADSSSSSSSSTVLSALYASLLLGMAFGVLSMVAALVVAVPATLVTWISVLVLLAFCGKPRRILVVEGKKLTAEIGGFVLKVLIKEGNIVAAVCAVLGYFALVRNHKESLGGNQFE